ncbi:MAG TPA: amino acid ABC transporter permease [Aggregatilineales bacterium]|nr:amino acid ABC transporter permease [Aggregatilineales bacterium]
MIPDLSARHKIALPGWLDRLTVRVAQWPWWALAIGFGLVLMFFSFATSNFYRRALDVEVDHFRLTTDQYFDVVYDVKASDGKTQRVSGVLTVQDAKSVTVVTQAESDVNLPFGDIASFNCGEVTDPKTCPLDSTVTLVRASITGALIQEDVGFFLVQTADGEQVKTLTFAIADKPKDQQQPRDELNPHLNKAVLRTPKGCVADTEGSCQVTLTLKPDDANNQITGTLKERDAEQIVVQTQPEQTTVIQRSDILSVINYTPKQCALNNLAACTEGIFLTPFLTIMAFLLALVIGLTLGLMRVSSDLVLFNLSTIYVEVMRGIPLVVILLATNFVIRPFLREQLASSMPALADAVKIAVVLLIIWFVLPRLFRPALIIEVIRTLSLLGGVLLILTALINLFNVNFNLDVLGAGILGLALCYGAFLAELFRAGIQSIGKGQMEAARSLGMTYTQAMRFVILPQAFRVILPPLGNEFIAILKDSSLLTILAIAELTQVGRLFAAATFKTFPVYITIGTLYLCMTLFLSFVVRVIERRSSIAHR